MKNHDDLSGGLPEAADTVIADLAEIKHGLRLLKVRAQIVITGLKFREKLIAMTDQEITDAINEFSTEVDSLSLKLDKFLPDVEALIAAAKAGNPSAALQAAAAKAQASLASVKAQQPKVDQTLTDVDAALPTPAPAGTP